MVPMYARMSFSEKDHGPMKNRPQKTFDFKLRHHAFERYLSIIISFQKINVVGPLSKNGSFHVGSGYNSSPPYL